MFVIHRLSSSGKSPQHGQALVEFALVAPIFFLLVFSVIQLGITFGGQNGLVAATREMARYTAPYRVKTSTDATQVCGDARLTTQLSNDLKGFIPGYNAANIGTRTLTYQWVPNAIETGGLQTYSVQMTVHVSYHFPMYVPLVGAFLDDHTFTTPSKLLDATETMRIENDGLTSTYSDVSCSI